MCHRRGGASRGRAPAPLIDSGARPAAHKGIGAGRGAVQGLVTASAEAQPSASHRAPLPTGPAAQSPGAPSAPRCQVRRRAGRCRARRQARSGGGGGCQPAVPPPARSSPWAVAPLPTPRGLGCEGRGGERPPGGRVCGTCPQQPRQRPSRRGPLGSRGETGILAAAGNWLQRWYSGDARL